MQKENIEVKGYNGAFYVVDTKVYENRILVLLENEEYGEDDGHLIAEVETSQTLTGERNNFILVMGTVWNGFEDLDYELENGKTIGELILSHFADNLEA